MSLISQVSSLTTRIGTEFKTVYGKIGNLASLSTTAKSDLVSAINELESSIAGAGAAINDAAASTSSVYSSSKTDSQISVAVDALIAGAPGALDTLNEIATQLGNDESAVSALTTTVGTKLAKASNLSDVASVATSRTNLSVYSQAEIGDPTTDLVAVFNAALV